MKRRKLLYIVEAMGGGVFTYFVDLANELVNSYEMYIAYAIRPQTPMNYRKQFDRRIHLIEVKNFTRSINLLKDIKAFFEIQEIAKVVNPDVIHVHSSKAGVLGRWAFNGKKMPLFYTPHGYSFLMSNYGWIKRNIFKTVEILSAKRNCTTISCSVGEHQETLKFTKNAIYVNNGININKLQKLIKSVKVKNKYHFTVFTLGRICYQKNPILFNKIAKALPDVKFLWIGDGELREQLTASNIKITGWVDRKEALIYSLSADLFMLTSLWEGLPMSLLEAMYMKKLCVVSDVIGNHNVIYTDENGFVCKDENEFVKVIEKAKVNQKSMERLEKNAFDDVIKMYNTVSMAESYREIYNNILKDREKRF